MADFYFTTADGRRTKVSAKDEKEALARANSIASKNKTTVSGPVTKSAKTIRATPASSTTTFDPLMYGAGGRGENTDPDVAAAAAEASSYGVPMSEVGNFISDPNYQISTLSKDQSGAIAKEFGLSGFGQDNVFAGLTRSQAREKATKLRKDKTSQNTALTSGAFNPETISGFKRKFKDLKFQIDSANNDPWENKKNKKDKISSLVTSYADQFANLFGNQDEFQGAMQDPEFAKSVREYERLGGSTADIRSKIANRTNQVSVIGETQNPDGSFNVRYSDGTSENRRYSANQDGTLASRPVQTLDQYLGAISTPAERRAVDSLIPEKRVYQDQIAFEQSIPEQYRDLYFGSEETVGLLQQKRTQAVEQIKLLERRAKLEEQTAQSYADLEIERNRVQQEADEAEIEENRLAAKNYMTGMLAKLGALNTTGAAPQAIATVEQKYQKQRTQLRSAYTLANRTLELDLSNKISEIQLARDEEINTIKGDMSKDEETILKEIFKLQNDADRKSLSVAERYASEFRTQREKYIKESKTAAEKALREYQAAAGKYDPAKVKNLLGSKAQEGDYVVGGTGKNAFEGIFGPGGEIQPFDLTPTVAQEVRNAGLTEQTAIQFYTNTPPEFRQYVVRSGLTGLDLPKLREEFAAWEKKKKTRSLTGE